MTTDRHEQLNRLRFNAYEACRLGTGQAGGRLNQAEQAEFMTLFGFREGGMYVDDGNTVREMTDGEREEWGQGEPNANQ